MRNFLFKVAEKITRKPRYHPEHHEAGRKLRWSNTLWTANIFRFHEYLFGRAYGIRTEASLQAQIINGKLYIKREFFTLEALLAHIEVTIRGYYSFFAAAVNAPDFSFNTSPAYVTFGLLGFLINFNLPQHLLPLVGLAIALDTSDGTHASSTSSASFSYTVTGSNPFLAVTHAADTSGSAVLSSATYNSVSLTNANVNGTGAAGSNKKTGIMYLAAPATGANTLAVTYSTTFTQTAVTGVISLSGTAQTSPVDTGSGSSAPVSNTTHSLTNTAANANEWQISVITFDTATLTASTNQTTRWTNNTNGFSHMAGGANVLAGSGSQAVIWTTNSGNNWAMSVIYVKPVPPAVNTTQDNSVKANILVAGNLQADSVKANVLAGTIQANSAKLNIKTTYYTGDTYDWKPANIDDNNKNRGFNS